MGKLKKAPFVLQRKLFLTFGIGVLCLVVGLSVAIFLKDRVMMALSAAVCLFSFLKGISLFRLIVKQQYEVVEGTCVSIANQMIRKYRKIKIMDDNGTESSLLLSKQAKIKIGYRYRFYFKDTQRLTIGSEYFDSALSSDCFLGFEELGEFTDIQQKDAELPGGTDA